VKEYILSVNTEFDLDEIWEYIAHDNIDAADRWIGKLFDAFESIARNPGISHRRHDLTEFPVLFWPVGAYLLSFASNLGRSRLLP